eukprot:TRINITY_DN30345_c0_g1_i1.p1 TRINITY_DN30345_c0_g1~~TRINITY_DN30345_c0_g1_i1.p1  ORF type:complete len:148 (-),score=15.99 TRINITY_DN30345_c0_g1_i1:388-831(-)
MLLFVLSLLVIPNCETKETSCQELGFTGLQACSDCARLGEFVKHAELVKECESCCIQLDTGDDSSVQYQSVVLEVCKYRLQGLPHIEEFVKNKAKKYKFLKIRYSIGAAPKLILYSEAGKDSIRIDNWKTEHVEEYLNDKFSYLMQQ